MNRLAQHAAALTATAALGATGLLALAPSASAKSGPEVVARGACAGAVWKLKGKHDDGRLEVELEVDSNRNGQTWAVVLTDNGARVFSGTRVTKAPSGSFSVERRIADRPGVDTVVATAKRGSATCTGRIRL